MRCSNCGTENAPENRYCKNCGFPLGDQGRPGRAQYIRPRPWFISGLWLRFMLVVSWVVLVAGVIAALAIVISRDLGWIIPMIIIVLSVFFFLLVQSDVEMMDRIRGIDDRTRMAAQEVKANRPNTGQQAGGSANRDSTLPDR